MSTREKILITGTQGLIGWNLYKQLPLSQYELYAFSKSRGPNTPNWYQGLLENPHRLAQIIESVQPDIVIHAHAMCNLDVCEQHPEKTNLVNVKGTYALLNALKFKSTRFVHISSEHVFSGTQGTYQEKDLTDPISVYGASREKAEEMVKKIRPASLIIRPGLVIGKSLQGNIGPLDWLRSRLEKNRPASFFVDEYRSPLRAFDFVAGVHYLLSHRAYGTYHLGGKTRMSRYELALRLAKELRLRGEILPKKRSGDLVVPRIADCSLDSTKAVRLGWKPTSLKEKCNVN